MAYVLVTHMKPVNAVTLASHGQGSQALRSKVLPFRARCDYLRSSVIFGVDLLVSSTLKV